MGSRRPIYITQPSLPPLEVLTPLLEQIWESKILTNGGPLHQRLEAALCEHLEVPYVALFNNATNALLVAVRALGLSGEVITTPYSFVATAHALSWSGVRPVFADISPDTFNLDPARIEAAISTRTTAIMPVHCYGYPCDVRSIEAIARRHKLRVLYDAAHAFGVRCHDQSVLAFGDLSVLSFHATKVFNTFEGGAIVCHTLEMKRMIEQLRNFGIADEEHIPQVGLNGKMSELHAAVGLLQLPIVGDAIARRLAATRRYRDGLSGVQGVLCMPTPSHTQAENGAYFPVLITEDYPLSRDDIYHALKAHQVYARRYFYPLLSDLPAYRGEESAQRQRLPHAVKVASQILCLPLFPDLSFEEVDLIVGLLRAPTAFTDA